jgi:hypothetical protein
MQGPGDGPRALDCCVLGKEYPEEEMANQT